MSIVLITVPHAQCPSPTVGHECDFAAKPFAQDLSEALGQQSVLRIPSENEFRKLCDLNRYRCRYRDYRKNLTAFMKDNSSRIKIVLDIHSFSSPHFDDVDVALLDNKLRGQTGFQQHTINLEQTLNENGLTCKTFFGTSIEYNDNPHKLYIQNNDIQDEARLDHNLPCILIEINERLLKEKDKWYKVASTISSWVS